MTSYRFIITCTGPNGGLCPPGAQEQRLISSDLERFPDSLLPVLIKETAGNPPHEHPIRLELPGSLAAVAPVAFGLYRGFSLPRALTALDTSHASLASIPITLLQLNRLADFFQLPMDIISRELREVRTRAVPPENLPRV